MFTKLHIVIAGPIATEHVANLLDCNVGTLPQGYTGAPLTAVLISELLKMGHKVSAITTDISTFQHNQVIKASGKNFDFYLCPQRPRAWRFNKFWPGRAVDGFAYERRHIARVMREIKPDVIHAHWCYEFALAALTTGLPHLISCHDDPTAILHYTPDPYRLLRYWMAKSVFRKGRLFSTVSDYMAKALQPQISQPLAVVANPLAAYVITAGHVRNVPTSRKIGMVCNGWGVRKNPQPALTAFAQYQQANPEAELHLFGHDFGPEQIAYQWCREQGILSGVYFHGAIPHKQLIAKLDEMDVLLHPALEESFGVVIAEAMALGLPVVAGKSSGAVPWVVGYKPENAAVNCALLVDVSSSRAIVAAIKDVFDDHYSSRSAFGYHRARENFSPVNISQAYCSLYQTAMYRSG